MFKFATALFAVLSVGAPAQAAEIKALSAGAVEPAIEAFAHQLKRDTGHDLKVLFNTAPQIAKRLASGEVFDKIGRAHV